MLDTALAPLRRVCAPSRRGIRARRDAILTRPHGSADLHRLQHHRRRGPRLPRPPPEPAADSRLHPGRRRARSPCRFPRRLRRGEHRADCRDRADPAPVPDRPRDQPPPSPAGRARDHGHGPAPGSDLCRAGLAGARPRRGIHWRPVRPALPRRRECDVVDPDRRQAPVGQVRAGDLRRTRYARRAHLPGSLRHRLPGHPAQPAEPAGDAPAALAGRRRWPRGRGLAHGALRPAGLLPRHREVLRARGGQRDGVVLPGGRGRGLGGSLEGDGRPDRGGRHRVLSVRERGHLAGGRRPGLLPHPLLRGARPQDPGAFGTRRDRGARRCRVRRPEPLPRHVPALRVPAARHAHGRSGGDQPGPDQRVRARHLLARRDLQAHQPGGELDDPVHGAPDRGHLDLRHPLQPRDRDVAGGPADRAGSPAVVRRRAGRARGARPSRRGEGRGVGPRRLPAGRVARGARVRSARRPHVARPEGPAGGGRLQSGDAGASPKPRASTTTTATSPTWRRSSTRASGGRRS